MIDYVFPELKLNQPKARPYETNDIMHRNIVIFGAQASGKSEFIRCLAEKFAEKYGSNKTITILSRFFPRLISSIGLIKVPVQMYVWGDSTLKKQKDDELAAFFNIRNLYWAKTGIREGYLITVNNMHDLFGIKKKMRSSVDAIFFRSLPTNKYDIRVAQDYLGEDKYNEFLDIIKRRDSEPKLKSITYYNIRGDVGRVEWDLAKNNHVIDIDTKKDILGQFNAGVSPTFQKLTMILLLGGVSVVLSYLLWIFFKIMRYVR